MRIYCLWTHNQVGCTALGPFTFLCEELQQQKSAPCAHGSAKRIRTFTVTLRFTLDIYGFIRRFDAR